ncbi:MAG: hypothetical protein B6D58_03755 [candidate division Zixibacteria bacterium 4484_95]|nr:MAG: hypothetical protein B6D58_03755 [candidate division Zixibacteria bacterium 4484_95]RKX19887.1 MAG: hypothetical protein DRP26_02660 [candidate division Zixibacteria bacterium]
MNLTLDYLKSNRKWLVPNLIVWGSIYSFDAFLMMVEENSSKRVVFSYSVIGGKDQVISFDELCDFNGNALPSEIVNPVVIIIPRDGSRCFLVGRPSNTSFKIACDRSSFIGQGLVDLLIMEVDLP